MATGLRSAGALLFLLLAGGPMAATGEELPAWARDLGLYVFGGPPPGSVEIELNGEFAARIVEGSPSSVEIADLLREGLNELKLDFRPGEWVSPELSPVRIRVAGSEALTVSRTAVRDPRLEVVVPADPYAEPCREEVRFWAGPPPPSPPALQRRYWLFFSGPAVHHRVTVVLNDLPVYSASSGNTVLEITRFVKRGKNTVTFDAVPTCFAPASEDSRPLTVYIASGRKDEQADKVVVDGPPLANFDLGQKPGAKPFTRAQAFRAK